MGVTLNIVEHELQPFGHVVRAAGDENPCFDDVRMFVAGKPVRANTLYLCGDVAEVASVSGEGASAVLVISSNAECKGERASAALTVFGEKSPLYVFDALLDVFGRFAAWQHDMERVCHMGGTLQQLVDASEPFLRNNVVVLDPALKLVAYTKGVPCDDPITMELIEHGYHTEDNIRKFKLHKRFKPWAEEDGFVINDTHEICKYVTVVKSFKVHTSFTLISVMMCNVEGPSPYLLDVFSLFADAVEFFALRDYPDGKPSGNAVDTFLNDLISGGDVNEEIVVERSRFVGLPHEAQFCLFYMKPEEDSVPIKRLLADVALVVAPAKAVLVGDSIAVLCFNCTGSPCTARCALGTCDRHRKTITERLDGMMKRYELTCGRSSKFTRLMDVGIAFQQAKVAYEQARREVVRSRAAGGEPNRILLFDQYGFDYLVSRLTDAQIALFMSTHAGSIVRAIADQDVSVGSDNYRFLYAYLVHERRTSVVAEAVHMHRNNVNYRIGRIEEQFGIDLSDPALRMDLLLAFRIRESLSA